MVLGVVGEALLQVDFAAVAQMADALGDSQTGDRTAHLRRSSRRHENPDPGESPRSVASTGRFAPRWRPRPWPPRSPVRRWPGSRPPTGWPAFRPSNHRSRRTRCRCRDRSEGAFDERPGPSRSRQGTGTRKAFRLLAHELGPVVPLTASQDIRADDEEAVRVDRRARADKRTPPVRAWVPRLYRPGHVRVATQGVKDEDSVRGALRPARPKSRRQR